MTIPSEATEAPARTTIAMPSVFVGVGGPRQMEDEAWAAQLQAWTESMPQPRAILLFSAHWLGYPMKLGATKPVPLVYDYYNFPAHYYDVEYAAPPAPELAQRCVELLGDRLEIEPSERGLDHGAFIGLMGMYPKADVPVLEVSIPTFHPETLFEIGRCLAPLRDEGVMIMGAGLMTHGGGQNPEGNRAFVSWVIDKIERRDLEALFQYYEIAPNAKQALPTVEHFVPLLIAYGAAFDAGGAILPGAGGAMVGGRRCFQFN